MYITLESDYAVRIVGCLTETGVRTDARTISEMTCVSLRFALKILRKLTFAGIIKSFKGTRGGYELAKEPSRISLMDVIEAIEGRYVFSRCLSEGAECSRGTSGKCAYQKVFREVSEDVRAKLSGSTFDKLT